MVYPAGTGWKLMLLLYTKIFVDLLMRFFYRKKPKPDQYTKKQVYKTANRLRVLVFAGDRTSGLIIQEHSNTKPGSDAKNRK